MKTIRHLALRLTLCAACAAAALGAHAQAAKTVVAEPVAILPSFNQWATTVAAPLADTVTIDLNTLRLLMASAAAPVAQPQLWQPRPVIVGSPELPLLADVGYQAGGGAWLPSFNYQGMHVKVVVLDATGRARQVRPLNAPIRPGERFKLRITPTFESVASLDRLVGDTWTLQRAGQVYPQAGMSVAMNPGETVDLPMAANEYFVLGSPGERLVLSVRHPRATGAAATDQPAYREDGARGSNYLQLVTPGRLPAFEQQIGASL